MTGSCAQLSENVQSMHGSLVRINTDYLVQIADLLNQMQLEAVDEAPAIPSAEADRNQKHDDSQTGKILHQLQSLLEQ